MDTPRHPSDPRCEGPLDRRNWLKIGGLSLGALASGLQPNLATLLAAEQRAKSAGTPGVDRNFSVILFWANGGPSHLDLFDLKPEAPAEYRGPFRPIATNVPGMEITELLPRLARIGDKITLLRSLHHERGEHSGGTHRFLTGYSSRQANLQDSEFPEIGSIVAKHVERQVKDIPLYIGNTKFYGGGPAYLGSAFGPYMPSPNPITSSGNNTYDPVPIYKDTSIEDNLAISADGVLALNRRRNLLSGLDRLSGSLDQAGTMEAIDVFNRRALEMLSSTRTRDAFDLSREDAATQERYGRSHWGQSLLTCRRLVEAGVRFVQCQANFRLRPQTGRITTWDDHSVNSDIFKAYEEKLPDFDQSVAALIEDLYQRGLDRHVLFIFCGEFGRTPKIANQDPTGRPGRDHWPRAMSVLLAGGGMRMGQVIGATNRKAEEPTERVMDSNCLLATLYRRFGIDPQRTFADLSGRPIAILPAGEPIVELL